MIPIWYSRDFEQSIFQKSFFFLIDTIQSTLPAATDINQLKPKSLYTIGFHTCEEHRTPTYHGGASITKVHRCKHFFPLCNKSEPEILLEPDAIDMSDRLI